MIPHPITDSDSLELAFAGAVFHGNGQTVILEDYGFTVFGRANSVFKLFSCHKYASSTKINILLGEILENRVYGRQVAIADFFDIRTPHLSMLKLIAIVFSSFFYSVYTPRSERLQTRQKLPMPARKNLDILRFVTLHIKISF